MAIRVQWTATHTMLRARERRRTPAALGDPLAHSFLLNEE
jgi:hypothetical protein